MAAALIAFAANSLEAAAAVATSYVAYRFEPHEDWRVTGPGDIAGTQLSGRRLALDFSKGVKWLSIRPPDRALLGNVEKIRFRVRGNAKGHPVRLSLRTHFMTFQTRAGEFAGGGEQEIVVSGPPGPGWEWLGGENDGKLHGPVRLGEIRFEFNGQADRPELELVSLTVEGRLPAENRCVLTAAPPAAGATEFSAEVRCLTDIALHGQIGWTFRDWERQPLGQAEREVTVPPGAERVVVRVPVPAGQPDRKFVEAEFRLKVSGQEAPAVTACWLAAQAPHTDEALRPESPFGIGMYLGRYRGAEMERAARAAREAGIKWSREDFSWSRIEPERGRYDWSLQDTLVETAKRNGISVYGIVAHWAPWTKPYTEEGIDDYCAFLRQLVRRYQHDIHQWEIWNEPNIFFWQGPREMYATLLKKSYAAIKEEDPAAEVLGISTSGIDFNFIAQMLARDTPFDILTIHPYRRVLDDRLFINELKIVSDLVRTPDGRRRPVWLTEMGWSTYTPHNVLAQGFVPTPPRVQAELIARSYLCAIVSGVEPRTFWYDFRNDGEEPLYFEHEMGIVRRDFQPKPAYYAYATLARVLKGTTLQGPIDAAPGVFAYRFASKTSAGSVIALWQPGADASVDLPVRARRAARVNAIGESQPVDIRNGRAVVVLKQGAPAYLILE